LLGKIEKLKMTTRENKIINDDSLVFYAENEKLFLFSSNGISSAKIFLCNISNDFIDFAIDGSNFINAFSNFPSDEVQLVFDQENNQLIFGNKKTRVSLKTFATDNISQKVSKEFFTNEEVEYNHWDKSSYLKAIKYTSFSCAPDFEEHPYSSIMFFIENDKFNAQSSDKHRISVYGKNYKDQTSYLITKLQAELSLNFLNDHTIFTIHKNKLILKSEEDFFCTNLEKNTFQSVFNNFKTFFKEIELIGGFEINKNEFIKSLKYISGTTSSHFFNITTQDTVYVLSASNNDKGIVADRIDLSESVPEIESSYVISHFLKALELISSDVVTLNFFLYNSFTICIVQDSSFNHLIFPTV
jgi:DNA polymerase III sliding clamp (beta) subunit (PCNA family)